MPTIPRRTFTNGTLVDEGTIDIPAETANADLLRERAANALARLDQIIAADPATATTSQVATAVQDMARHQKAIIRLLIGALGSAD